MYIRKSNVSTTELCWTLADTDDELEHRPRSTVWNQLSYAYNTRKIADASSKPPLVYEITPLNRNNKKIPL